MCLVVWVVSVGDRIHSMFSEVSLESCTQIVKIFSCLESACFFDKHAFGALEVTGHSFRVLISFEMVEENQLRWVLLALSNRDLVFRQPKLLSHSIRP